MIDVRNREKTESKILEAVSELVLKEGIKKLGINSIARKAGVDKVLIYRYFDGFNGLLKTYIRKQDFFANFAKFSQERIEDLNQDEIPDHFKKIFLMQLSYLRNNKELQEILLWELSNKDEITDFIASEREKVGIEILNMLKSKASNFNVDIEAFSTLIICAINQIVLRSRTVDVFSGMDLTKEESWIRFENTIELIIDLLKIKKEGV